jgi:hypothetical protein
MDGRWMMEVRSNLYCQTSYFTLLAQYSRYKVMYSSLPASPPYSAPSAPSVMYSRTCHKSILPCSCSCSCSCCFLLFPAVSYHLRLYPAIRYSLPLSLFVLSSSFPPFQSHCTPQAPRFPTPTLVVCTRTYSSVQYVLHAKSLCACHLAFALTRLRAAGMIFLAPPFPIITRKHPGNFCPPLRS